MFCLYSENKTIGKFIIAVEVAKATWVLEHVDEKDR